MLMLKLVLIAPLVTQAVLYVLMGLSVLSIAVIIERWWFFSRRKADMTELGDGLRRALHKHDVNGAREVLRKSRAVEAEMAVEALDWYSQGPEAIEQILPKAIRTRRKKLDAGLVFLGTLGNNAPFIGLFGTVLGIVTGFHELGNTTAGAGGAAGGMNNVMAAIGEALIATAIGILVAIPAVVAFNIFSKKGADIEENAHSLGNIILANLRSVGGAPLPEPVAAAPRTPTKTTTKPAAPTKGAEAEA
jgi:biopolymer transport protein ExbB/TolQ